MIREMERAFAQGKKRCVFVYNGLVWGIEKLEDTYELQMREGMTEDENGEAINYYSPVMQGTLEQCLHHAQWGF